MGWRGLRKENSSSPKATESRGVHVVGSPSCIFIDHGKRKVGEPPRDVICHICGRKYTIHSIHIHIPQCEKLYLAQQEKLPKNERKRLPTLPTNVSKMNIHQRNKVAQELFENVVMEKCPYCGRTFMEGRLAKHIHSCARSHGKSLHIEISHPDKEHTWSTYSFTTNKRPTEAKNTVICYVCGQKYTTHSINIHLPQCKKLFLARHEKLPRKDRKQLPQEPPPNLTSLEERNDFATKQYNNAVLEACKYCNRTFFPDRLAVHIKSCERNHIREKMKNQQHHAHQKQQKLKH